ncbi:MAG: FAD-binding oxidoreductase [bacterium]
MSPITQSVRARLLAIVGERGAVASEFDAEPYAHDETEDLVFPPEIIVRPENTAEVAAVVRLANEEGIPVTPRGGGTGLSGGALAVHGGIVLSLERFRGILEIDRENFFVVCQPGVITEVLQNTVEEAGLFYPPDPASKGSCTIGGNLAECAGGPRALKYGVTKDYVYGIEAVLPTGDIVRYGGKLLKNVTGYNMTQLLIGSEGTLGIITEVTLKLLPLPRHRKTLLAPFASVRDAARTVALIFQAGVVPSACEFMERAAINAVEEMRGEKVPHSDAAAHLLIEVDGNFPDALDRDIDAIAAVCEENGAIDVMLADTPARQKELWATRRAMGEAVKKRSIYKEEDTVVPRFRLPELLEGVHAIVDRYGIAVVCYGHAGDGNIHVNLLKEGLDDETWNERIPLAIREIFTHVKALGGTLSGEHGIGWVQRDYMPIVCSPEEIESMRRVKRALDPRGILNPSKVLPDPTVNE